MKTLPLMAALALATAAPAAAQDVKISEDKTQVLACLDSMSSGTTWGQCVTMMFAPCAAQEPGTDPHAACLKTVHTDWFETVVTLQNAVMERASSNGRSQVVDLMGFWSTFVDQKCTEVAAAKETGAESARLGCEISEFAGLTGEFSACLNGRSQAEYCELSE